MISLKPSKIRFMHHQINNRFRRGKSVNETIESIAAGRMSIHTLPRIRVCKKDGFYYAFDNRRLYVYRVLQKRNKLDKITVNVALRSQFQESRFSTRNNGKSVTMRRGDTLEHAHATSPASSDDEDDKPNLSFQTLLSSESQQSDITSSKGLLSAGSTTEDHSSVSAKESNEEDCQDVLSSILEKVVEDCDNERPREDVGENSSTVTCVSTAVTASKDLAEK